MKPIRFAVIGAHRRGRISLLAHRPADGLHLVAACGSSPEGLEPYHEACGKDLFVTTDYREILARPDIDAVFICTPDHLHFEHAMAALGAGKHVFLEKPMAITPEDCDAILREASRPGCGKLFVGHNMRFFPVIRKMHELIEEGRIGQVQAVWCRHFISYGGEAYFKDWHSERKYTHSLLLQKGAHDIDVIHYLAGGYTERVVGMGKLSVYNQIADKRDANKPEQVVFNTKNWPPLSQKGMSPVIDVEDHNMLLMQLGNGVQASYLQCHYTPDDSRNYTIIGTEGRIENYGDHSTETYNATVQLWNTRKGGFDPKGTETFEIPYLDGSHGGSDPMMIDDFIHFLRTGEYRGATTLDARMSVVTGYLGAQSVRNGSVPYDVPAFKA